MSLNQTSQNDAQHVPRSFAPRNYNVVVAVAAATVVVVAIAIAIGATKVKLEVLAKCIRTSKY